MGNQEFLSGYVEFEMLFRQPGGDVQWEAGYPNPEFSVEVRAGDNIWKAQVYKKAFKATELHANPLRREFN